MDPQELEREVLRTVREQMAPSASDRMRNQAAFLAQLTESVPSPPTGQATGGLRGSGVGLSVGLLIGGMVGFGVGTSVRETATPPAVAVVRHSSPEVVTAPPVAKISVPSALKPSAPKPKEVPPLRVVQEFSVERAVAPVTRKRTTVPRPARARSPSSRSSLAEELAMLQRARRALNRENGNLALGLVEELDERFPRGVLIEERRATRVLALCQLKRVEDAMRFGRRFLTEHPRSVYADRVRSSCVSGP